MMSDIAPLAEVRPPDGPHVGGKGLSLGLLLAAGLPVPDGFCVTTTAHRRLGGRPAADDDALSAAITEAYNRLGGGPVAVRSSAVAEDGAVSSFAGQQETFLGVRGADEVVRAVGQCWASLESERAVAYRGHQGAGAEGLAVVVQRLVPAEVAGVLFTSDPTDPGGRQLLVEAAWGLGESVVSGRVSPDRYQVDRDTGQVVHRHVAVKAVQRTPAGEEPVPAEQRQAACLDDAQLAELAGLSRRVDELCGGPRDVEWAFAGGRLWLLQARPITAAGAAERERVRREEVEALRARAAPRGTVWSRYNLAETLPAPTPMTWAVLQRLLLSGRGAFGQMVRDLGFAPHPALDEAGIFDLVCGRAYCNLSREALLHDRDVPFEHPFALLKADPRRALYPVPAINPAAFPWHFWLTLPVALPRVALRLLRGAIRRQRLVKSFADTFCNEVVPTFLRRVEADRRAKLTAMDDAAVVAFFEASARATLVEFARDSLKPTALAAECLGGLQRRLAQVMAPAHAGALARDLCAGARPDADTDLAAAVRALAQGALSREQFLDRFGHRGPEEMELSQPRWREAPQLLDGLAAGPPRETLSPRERLAAESRFSDEQRRLLLDDVVVLHTYLGLRETARHHLLAGYEQVRRALVELDRRWRLGGGVFYLTPDELAAVLRGEDVGARIAQRRRRRALALGIEVPPVLFSDDLEAVGRPMSVEAAELLHGVPLSAGVAEGPALVLERPEAAPAGGYILVCPSTDPAWVPLFVAARGLVMETGGVLSHGAIVAREFGLPAVAGIAVRRLRTGQRLRVDGGQGTVAVLG